MLSSFNVSLLVWIHSELIKHTISPDAGNVDGELARLASIFLMR